MKKNTFFSGILVMLLSIVACSKSSYNNNGGGGNNNTSTIYMKNSVFSNTSLQIVKGSTVTWKNDDNMAHTVTADNNSFDSGDMQPNASFSYTFNSTGTFAYHCKYHSNMTATVIVIAN